LLRNYTDDRGFLAKLEDYIERLNQDTSIYFRLDTETREIDLDAPVELELMRTCQEAVTNIKKHSNARNVQVKLRRVNGHYEVSIIDDGCGFDALSQYHDELEGANHGLEIMRERVESAGGTFQVTSVPGQGTRVQIEVPANHKQGRLLWPKK